MVIRTIKLKKLLLYLALTFVFGFIGALLGGGTGQIYSSINKPPLSPPAIVFPIVWSILYLLMGISAYFLSNERNPKTSDLLKLYWIQLVLNALWPLVFWRLEAYKLAAVIIVLILILVVIITIKAFKINKLSSYLLIPYIIWLLFALYLNIAIAVLN
ncbi:MAG: tryptophan-rich sensory protein [Ruminococcaceae bacterium]|nr:tryptophan-rich sensory protein [Oscillospiraceae bacterium]